jgi:kynurenine formamidase
MIHPIAALLADYDTVDLGRVLEEGMPAFPAHSEYSRDLWESYWDGDIAVAYQITLNEHSGTHVDAPAHFMRDDHPQHIWIDKIEPKSLIGRAVLIDVRETPERGEFGIDCLDAFEAENGEVGTGDIVLFRTGWGLKWGIGDAAVEYKRNWPGPSADLARALAERGVAAVGTDAMVLDAHGTTSFPSHYELLGRGVLILENLANLEKLPPVFYVVAIPLAIAGGSGSPIRPLAFVPKAGASSQ